MNKAEVIAYLKQHGHIGIAVEYERETDYEARWREAESKWNAEHAKVRALEEEIEDLKYEVREAAER